MGDITDVRAPQLWRRPHAKIYGYNQDFSANYYSVTQFELINLLSKSLVILWQPMLDYVKTKNRQGIFFTKPEEKIHLPDGAELVMRTSDQRFCICHVQIN